MKPVPPAETDERNFQCFVTNRSQTANHFAWKPATAAIVHSARNVKRIFSFSSFELVMHLPLHYAARYAPSARTAASQISAPITHSL